MNDKLRAAHEKLLQAVAEIASGDDWKRMLQVVSKFHRYSFNNHLMIFLQRPDATVVAGFNRWKSLGRHVKKGQKGIAIFAPCKYKTKIETEEGDEKSVQQVRGFRVVHVFDISQTEGDELPDLDAVRPKLLDAAAPDGVWDALTGHATSIGYEVVRHQRASENGYCDFLNKQIAVRPDVSPAQAVKTLIHELGHALLHAEGAVASREVAEVEVESVAFIVCDALGLDSGDYSFPYVTRWAEGSEELIRETAERAVECAKSILSGMGVREVAGDPATSALRYILVSTLASSAKTTTRKRASLIDLSLKSVRDWTWGRPPGSGTPRTCRPLFWGRPPGSGTPRTCRPLSRQLMPQQAE